MSAGKAASLRQGYTELAKSIAVGDLEKALRTCNRLLKISPTEQKAFQSKIICLIKLDKFSEALAEIRKTPPLTTGNLAFEIAYCHYRLNHDEEAIKILEKSQDDDLRKLELLAQVYYRMKKYTNCQNVYQRLLKEYTDNSDSERLCNFLAVQSNLAEQEQNVELAADEELDMYEQMYNKSCALIAQNKAGEAVKLLKRAEKICTDELKKDGALDDEIDDELSMLRAQSAYSHQKAGNKSRKEIIEIYQKILRTKPSDPVVAAACQINLVATKAEQNTFEVRKRLKTSSAIITKMSPTQRRIYTFNDALLHIRSIQYEAALKVAAQLKDDNQDVVYSKIIEACVLAMQKNFDQAGSLLENVPSTNSLIPFLLPNIYMLKGDASHALTLLNKVPKIKNSIAYLSIEVALKVAQNNIEEAVKLLEDALKQNNLDDSVRAAMHDHCAILLTQEMKLEKAAEHLDTLRKLRSGDEQAKVVARLMKAYVQFDQLKADALSKEMAKQEQDAMDTTQLAQSIEILESSEYLLLGERYTKKRDAKHLAMPSGKLRVKRKRKTKLPPGADPNVRPDSERWLPKHERSTFKKKGRKRDKERDIGRGTQGGADATEAAKLDASNRPFIPGTPKQQTTPVTAGPRQQRPGGKKAVAKKKAKK